MKLQAVVVLLSSRRDGEERTLDTECLMGIYISQLVVRFTIVGPTF